MQNWTSIQKIKNLLIVLLLAILLPTSFLAVKSGNFLAHGPSLVSAVQNQEQNQNQNQTQNNTQNQTVNQNVNATGGNSSSTSSSSSSSNTNVTINNPTPSPSTETKLVYVYNSYGQKVLGTATKSVVYPTIDTKGNPQVVGQVQSDIKELPKTGLPLAGIGLASLLPGGWIIRRLKRKENFEESANSVWTERQLGK